uniref:serine/threonine-protein kinase n=1 Tax=Prochlorothrix hollandica TaxID=1223 RepID=UPI003340703D
MAMDRTDPINAERVRQGAQDEAEQIATWPKGHRLQGAKEYEILKPLGQGGFGVTYQAKVRKTGEWVVIKAVKRLSNYDPSKHSQDFVGEFTTLMKLAGIPHVVQPIDLIYDDGRQLPAIVLEWVSGSPLQPLLSPEVAIVCMQQVGQALIQAHQRGILHRDIKPANLLKRQLTNGQIEIVVVDWGAARHFTENDPPTGFSSQWYSSREQRKNFKEDPRSDLYSLCVTFYELITGWSLRDWKPGTPLPQPKGLDPHLWRIFVKGLAVQKKKRYASVETLLQALERWVKRSEVVLPESVTEAFTDPPQRGSSTEPSPRSPGLAAW